MRGRDCATVGKLNFTARRLLSKNASLYPQCTRSSPNSQHFSPLRLFPIGPLNRSCWRNKKRTISAAHQWTVRNVTKLPLPRVKAKLMKRKKKRLLWNRLASCRQRATDLMFSSRHFQQTSNEAFALTPFPDPWNGVIFFWKWFKFWNSHAE